MKIISEKTKKEYPTVEACLEAEKEFDELMAKKKAEAEERVRVKKARAVEVEGAYKKAVEAERKYVELRNQFIKDYGSFHMTYSNIDHPIDAFEKWISMFFS